MWDGQTFLTALMHLNFLHFQLYHWKYILAFIFIWKYVGFWKSSMDTVRKLLFNHFDKWTKVLFWSKNNSIFCIKVCEIIFGCCCEGSLIPLGVKNEDSGIIILASNCWWTVFVFELTGKIVVLVLYVKSLLIKQPVKCCSKNLDCPSLWKAIHTVKVYFGHTVWTKCISSV